MGMNISRENFLLDAIYDDARQELNPSGEDCPECGGEGWIADCFDGCCIEADSGCEDCMRRCVECVRHEAAIERYVRVQVLRAMDIPLARAWAQRKGRSAAQITDQQVLQNIHAGRAACKEFTAEERADSACWVEGLWQ